MDNVYEKPMKSTGTVLICLALGYFGNFAEGVNLEAASIMYLLAAALAAAGLVNLIVHHKKRG